MMQSLQIHDVYMRPFFLFKAKDNVVSFVSLSSLSVCTHVRISLGRPYSISLIQIHSFNKRFRMWNSFLRWFFVCPTIIFQSALSQTTDNNNNNNISEKGKKRSLKYFAFDLSDRYMIVFCFSHWKKEKYFMRYKDMRTMLISLLLFCLFVVFLNSIIVHDHVLCVCVCFTVQRLQSIYILRIIAHTTHIDYC